MAGRLTPAFPGRDLTSRAGCGDYSIDVSLDPVPDDEDRDYS
jgi:hypothetical protein